MLECIAVWSSARSAFAEELTNEAVMRLDRRQLIFAHLASVKKGLQDILDRFD